MAVPELIDLMGSKGILFSKLESVKEKALKVVSRPNIHVAKVIYNYLPPYGGGFDE
ncbi:MAG: hypothetical protein RXQ22_04945 [Sulfolobus sp.]